MTIPSVRELRQSAADNLPYREIRPNSKPQWDFLASRADVALYGGAAGGGKTFALLMEAARWLHVRRFGSVFFRRTRPELTQEKGAWDKSQEIYYGMGGAPNFQELKWYFRGGASVKFASLQHEKNVKDWGSSQLPLVLIDQVETFTEKMFWGLWGRCRTDIGIRPYMRMACNPSDNWLLTLFEWWIDDEGFAIPERSGKVRYAYRYGEEIHWSDTPENLIIRFSRPGRKVHPISFTFIPAKLSDNVDLETADPEYRAKLELLPYDERMRLLGDDKRGGNWRVKFGAGMFPEGSWRLIDRYHENAAYVRFWDTAASTKADNDTTKAATAGVLMAIDHEGPVVLDVVEVWEEEAARMRTMRNTAELDRQQYGHVVQWVEEEGGGAGKDMAGHYIRLFSGMEAYTQRPERDKVTRARPWASVQQAGGVRVLITDWTKGFIDQHKAFPFASRKDKVDAAAGAYSKVADMTPPEGTGIVEHNEPSIIDRIGHDAFR